MLLAVIHWLRHLHCPLQLLQALLLHLEALLLLRALRQLLQALQFLQALLHLEAGVCLHKTSCRGGAWEGSAPAMCSK